MMRAGAVTVAALCAIAVTGCDLAPAVGDLSARTTAQTRVRSVLNGWRVGADGRESNLQTAVCQWYRGVNAIADLDELARAQSGFETWRGEKGLQFQPIQTFEITGAEVDSAEAPARVRVDVVVDGRPMAMLVTSREPIRWAPG